MGTLIVNFKNYPEVLGKGSLRLAMSAQRVAETTGADLVVAPPSPFLALVASAARIPVYSQSVGREKGDKTTGATLPEAVSAAGAKGTILNHSESRRTLPELRILIPRLQRIGLEVCLCARTSAEAARLAKFRTKYLAVEPPELIGSGMAVSTARPELVARAASAVREAGYSGKLLCGAGIVSGRDVSRAVELGVDGVLVSSSVVKAADWDLKLGELARSLG